MPDIVNSGSITLADGTSGVNPPLGSYLDIGVEDHPAVSLDLEGAFTATLVIEAIAEAGPAGADWFTPVVLNAALVASSASLTAATRRFLSGAGVARVRLRCTAFTAGPISATWRAGQGSIGASGGGGGGGGAVTVGDGADTALGSTSDAGIITNIAGTAIGFLRGQIIQWAAFLARFPAALVGGRLDVNLGAAPASVTTVGTLTPNNAAPGATNLGALTGLANAAAPTLTEGDQTLLSQDLHGNLRVLTGGYTPPTPTGTFTRGANVTAYTIGDEVGTAGTAPTPISVARFNGGSGLILGAQVTYSSYAAVIPQLVLLLFSGTVTLAGDNAQLNLADGDAALLIGWIPLTASLSGQYSAGAPVAAGNTVFLGAPTSPFEFTCGAAQTTIYAALVTLNAFTPIANSETLIVTLRVEGN